jgi:hypothetical protein
MEQGDPASNFARERVKVMGWCATDLTRPSSVLACGKVGNGVS